MILISYIRRHDLKRPSWNNNGKSSMENHHVAIEKSAAVRIYRRDKAFQITANRKCLSMQKC